MSLAKGMENLDDFQKKYGNIYDAIFERGVEAGLKGTNTDSKPGIADAQSVNFEEIVQGFTAQGFSRSDAIRKAVKKDSAAHESYLARVNDLHAQKLPAKSLSPFKKFEDAVQHFVSQGQGSTAAAIKSAVAQYPELHAEYVARLKQGEKGVLCRS